MTPEERVQVQTTAHKARTAWVFGIFVLVVLWFVFWVTETPKRWLPIVIAIACGIGMYFALR